MSITAYEEDTGIKAEKQQPWKHIVITLIFMLAAAAVIYVLKVPNPNIILLTGVVIFTSLYGYLPGVVSGIITIAYSMFFFSTDRSFIHYTGENLQKLAVIVLGVIVNLWFIGHLKKRNTEASEHMAEMNRMLVLDNFALQEATMTDPLTGVKNRFAFRRDYSEYSGKQLHVMMMDIDDFKGINDTYGHGTGDYILKMLGGALIEVFGKESSYRYGGDEFLVVTEDMEEDVFKGCISVVYSLLKDIHSESGDLDVYFSAGYVWGIVKEPDDLRLMLRQADSKLYEVKHSKKNAFTGCEYSRLAAEKIRKNPKDTVRRT